MTLTSRFSLSVAHIPTPCFTSAGPSLVSLPLRRIAGMHPEHGNSQSQPLGPRAGEGQIKASLAPSIFPPCTSNQPHSGVVSCLASACPSPPFIHPMGAQAHHRAATIVSSGSHCEEAMTILVSELKVLTPKYMLMHF